MFQTAMSRADQDNIISLHKLQAHNCVIERIEDPIVFDCGVLDISYPPGFEICWNKYPA